MTRPPTSPGSETTDLEVGDHVIAKREKPGSGTWARFAGRKGWVASINRQTFDSGVTYVEIGVAWTLRDDLERMAADHWFRDDELVRA